MGRNRPGIFRSQLLVQKFPKLKQHLSTFHTPCLVATPLLAAVEDKNSRDSYLVPQAENRLLISRREV